MTKLFIISLLVGIALCILIASCEGVTPVKSTATNYAEHSEVTRLLGSVIRVLDTDYNIVCYYQYYGDNNLFCIQLSTVPEKGIKHE